MSKLSELIQQYCPDGVIYSTVGKKLGVNRGKRLTKSQLLNNGKYTVYHGSKYTPLGFYASSNVKGNTTIVVNTGGIGGVKYCEENFWCSDGSFWIGHTDDMNDKFVYYWISKFEEWFTTQKRVGGVPTIDRDTVASIEIPVPPMPVQEEIVRILDKFTELETELSMRKKQYEYYRDKLLSLEDYEGEVKWKPLRDIATNWFRGNGIKRDEVLAEGLPCVRYGEIYTSYGLHFDKCVSHTLNDVIRNPKVAKKGTILFAITGESTEDIAMSTAYLGEDDIYVGGDILAMEHEQDAKYLAYALSTTNARQQKSKGKIKSKVVHSNKNDISEIVIPVPNDINDQKRIADILDKFYNLISDISEGLPAEIKMRHQQYEYYRDKLLNFKRLEKND